MTRQDVAIYGGAALLSIIGHLGLIGGLGRAAHAPRDDERVVELTVLAPPPPIDLTHKPLPKKAAPPPPNVTQPEVPRGPPPPPVFGISMSSVVGPGASTMAVPVGNTLMKEPDKGGEAKPYAVPLYEVTTPPRLRTGQCKAAYPPDAKRDGIQGRVELEVEVLADGSVGEVRVIKKLGHGLDEAAVAAIKLCPFEPAVLAGQNVATRITYGFTFVIED